jgi:uncharacterized protein (DUF1800 family)
MRILTSVKLRRIAPLLAVILLLSFSADRPAKAVSYQFPYQAAGLSKEQAAEHLLSRFSFGVRPGDIEAATKMGLENWFEQQLNGGLADEEVATRLQGYDALAMSNQQIITQFPRGPQVRNMAVKDGFIKESELKEANQKDLRKLYDEYRQKKGLRPERELFRQFISQKIVTALYSHNQLHQVMTDFWFNHFNVSITKPQCASFIPVYERDAIRPYVTGRFEEMLLATAKSPAMLLYLDNFSSMGKNEEMEDLQQRRMARLAQRQKEDTSKRPRRNQNQGLNENYAREVMELHTLGVDGGYTQKDVTEAARVLTGWTIFPAGDYAPGGGQIQKLIERFGESTLAKRGFVREGDFLFAVNRHDDQPKTVLGASYNGGGYQEGVTLLKTLATHASTAKFICKKIATRFISDAPPASIIEKMAATFSSSKGDIKQVLIAMVSAPEFWNKDALREKTKSPFEYVISSLRSLNADVTAPFAIFNWVEKMGQKVYFYQAPTGFPDRAQYWINTGSLLNRMNFGLALAGKRIPGVDFDLAALNKNREPESAEAALKTYAAIIIPQRNLEATIKRLTPLVNDPSVGNKVNEAANKNNSNKQMEMMDESGVNEITMNEQPVSRKERRMQRKDDLLQTGFGDNSMLAQVVGIIIGSPEFQRR